MNIKKAKYLTVKKQGHDTRTNIKIYQKNKERVKPYKNLGTIVKNRDRNLKLKSKKNMLSKQMKLARTLTTP